MRRKRHHRKSSDLNSSNFKDHDKNVSSKSTNNIQLQKERTDSPKYVNIYNKSHLKMILHFILLKFSILLQIFFNIFNVFINDFSKPIFYIFLRITL